MNCREFTEFLLAYMNGELPQGERQEFDRHMGLCPPCVHYLEGYRKTVEIARGACKADQPVPSEVPEALVKAILAAKKQAKQ
jgi:anti-sigma factor RsiW